MITYLIRQDSDWQFTVSKWDGGILPVAVYRVEIVASGRSKCNCASGSHRGYCKHTDLVKDWRKRGMPMEELIA
jgi:hypothetical protein